MTRPCPWTKRTSLAAALGLLLMPPLAAGPAQSPPVSVSVQGGRLFLTYSHHPPTPIVGVQNASQPCLSPDGRWAVYVRAVRGAKINTGAGDADPNQLWLLDTATGKTTRLVAGNADSDVRQILAGLNNPVFSADGRQVFFLSSAWATSDAVHAVALGTRRVRFVCDGNSVEVVRRGRHRGRLIVGKHKYHPDGRGAYDAFWLVSPQGQEIARWGNEEL